MPTISIARRYQTINAFFQIIVNYAAFLEDNQYFEESFKVYERGVELFTYPVAFELWNIYLSKFVKRYVSVPIVDSYFITV